MSCESYFKCNLQSQVESNSIVGGSAWAPDLPPLPPHAAAEDSSSKADATVSASGSGSATRTAAAVATAAAIGIEWQSRVARNANNCTPMQTQTGWGWNRAKDSGIVMRPGATEGVKHAGVWGWPQGCRGYTGPSSLVACCTLHVCR